MLLTFANRTNDSIVVLHPVRSDRDDDAEVGVLNPIHTRDVQLGHTWRKELLFRTTSLSRQPQHNEESKECLVNPGSLRIRFSMAFGASWQVIQVPDECPWRIYCSRVTRKHHKIVILPKRNMSSFLAELPDSLPLSALVLPGTHDTMAFYGYPISQCQSPSTPLSTQFLLGIRVIDIRLAIINGQLIAYHGVYPQRTPFSNILASVYAFLTSPHGCKETIIMSIKQEDFAVQHHLKFSKLVKASMMANPGGWKETEGSIDRGMWFLENRIPNLGEVRGKVVLFSRFGGNGEGWEGGWEGMGIHPLVWPDSSKEGFEWKCKDTLVKAHDWYNINSFLSIPEKVALSTRILIPDIHPDDSSRYSRYKPKYTAPIPQPQRPSLAITFLSAAAFPLSLPPTIARGFGWPKIGLGVEGVNSRVAYWLLGILGGEGKVDLKNDRVECSEKQTDLYEDEKRSLPLEQTGIRIRGWVLMDYFNEPENGGLAPLLVECNFHGRRAGEEGWPVNFPC